MKKLWTDWKTLTAIGVIALLVILSIVNTSTATRDSISATSEKYRLQYEAEVIKNQKLTQTSIDWEYKFKLEQAGNRALEGQNERQAVTISQLQKEIAALKAKKCPVVMVVRHPHRG